MMRKSSCCTAAPDSERDAGDGEGDLDAEKGEGGMCEAPSACPLPACECGGEGGGLPDWNIEAATSL